MARPRNIEELRETIKIAKKEGLSVCPIGNGRSYGDEILNEDNVIIDCSKMDRILSWDFSVGVMTVEPGVTLQKALEVCLKDNWKLPVVPGTRFPTIGGCAANNVHGKNSYKVGNFGSCVLEFDILLSSLEHLTCSRKQNSDLFFAAIGGLGMLGVFTRIQLQLEKILSPYLSVKKWTVPNFQEMINDFITHSSDADYIVSHVDYFKKGAQLGRGTIHSAKAVNNSMSDGHYIRDIETPKNVIPLIPNSVLEKLGRMFTSSIMFRLVNIIKFKIDSLSDKNDEYIYSFPKFHFLLDRIPYWPGLYKNGFCEIEPLIPVSNTYKAYKELISLFCQIGLENRRKCFSRCTKSLFRIVV
jgi:hypothetical protein